MPILLYNKCAYSCPLSHDDKNTKEAFLKIDAVPHLLFRELHTFRYHNPFILYIIVSVDNSNHFSSEFFNWLIYT